MANLTKLPKSSSSYYNECYLLKLYDDKYVEYLVNIIGKDLVPIIKKYIGEIIIYVKKEKKYVALEFFLCEEMNFSFLTDDKIHIHIHDLNGAMSKIFTSYKSEYGNPEIIFPPINILPFFDKYIEIFGNIFGIKKHVLSSFLKKSCFSLCKYSRASGKFKLTHENLKCFIRVISHEHIKLIIYIFEILIKNQIIG